MKEILLYALITFIFSVTPLYAQPHDAAHYVVYINSYNTDYDWGKRTAAGVTDILEHNNVKSDTFFLDSHKLNDAELTKKAEEIRDIIITKKPDAIIITDDAAAKYVIAPYFLNGDIPIVFSGINWDAAQYGLTPKNSTGMIEINPTDELLNFMNRIVGRTDETARIGIISVDNMSQRKNYEYDLKKYNIRYNQAYFVSNMDEWENAYRELQKNNDYIFMPNLGGIKDWNDERAFAVIEENKKVPTCSAIDSSARFVMLTFAKYPEEQGRFAAKAALMILNGKEIGHKTFAVNKEARVILNRAHVENLGISVPRDILELSEIIP